VSKYNQKHQETRSAFLQLSQDPLLPQAVIVDIDGTVATMNQRKLYEWYKVDTDSPNKPVIGLVEDLSRLGNTIIFLSGRDQSCEDKTRAWLNKELQLNWNNTLLFMRKKGDMRKDTIIKRELFEREILGKYFVRFVLDDRDSVVALWRKEIGLVCLQVDYGDF
jgi:hypothetical protein